MVAVKRTVNGLASRELKTATTCRNWFFLGLSSIFMGEICYSLWLAGGVPEWLKGADCKSVGLRLRWFESSLLHHKVLG